MKQIPIALILVAATLSLAADDGETRQSWLVATRGPTEVLLDARAEVDGIGPVGNRAELRARTSTRFRHVDGFVAELTPSEARALEKLPLVRWVEPNLQRSLLSNTPVAIDDASPSTQQIPYGIAMIGAPEVWPVSRGRSVKVGIIDTGIDRNHPDLAGHYRGGRDFVNRDDDPQDDHGHGTHVAGTIAALDNDLGVIGVAPDAEIYGLKVLGANGSGTVSALIEAVDWAIDHHLDVINMSLGDEKSSALEKEAFDRAEQAGIISVAASGNSFEGLDRIDYPANYPSVVAVGAVDFAEAVAVFSQRGANLDFVAPGVGVDSTYFSTFYGITTSDGARLHAEKMDYSPGGATAGELVDCGLGMAGECPPSVKGRIALIRRGELTFAEKSKNAQLAGATAVVIYNHNADDTPEGGVFFGTLASEGDWLLTLGTSRSNGEHMLSLTDRNVSIGEVTESGYARLNGTSMATPHVAGAIAILRALAPTASKFAILETLRSTARDLGSPGRDNTFGYGRIDLNQAARRIAPEAFTVGNDSRRRSIRRPGSGN